MLLMLVVVLAVTATMQVIRAPSTHAAAGSLKPGTLIRAASCEQAPPQAQRDRASYTPAELARYGLPTQSSGESFAHWAAVVRGAKHRICDRTATAIRDTADQRSNIWDGNIADGDGQTYTSIDMDFTVPCLSPGYSGSQVSNWVGLGGFGSKGVNNLVQTGTAGQETYVANFGWVYSYSAFVENTGDASNPNRNDVFPVNCGDQMYVQVKNGNCMFVDRLADGTNSYQCYGPSAYLGTAEAITERPSLCTGNQCSPLALANFGAVTFHGVGIVHNGHYYAMNQLTHDYSNMYSTDRSHLLATVGPIQNDPGDPPYDKWTMNYVTGA